ncbi:MAG: hypothetical protein V4510_10450 [bacterium]
MNQGGNWEGHLDRFGDAARKALLSVEPKLEYVHRERAVLLLRLLVAAELARVQLTIGQIRNAKLVPAQATTEGKILQNEHRRFRDTYSKSDASGRPLVIDDNTFGRLVSRLERAGLVRKDQLGREAYLHIGAALDDAWIAAKTVPAPESKLEEGPSIAETGLDVTALPEFEIDRTKKNAPAHLTLRWNGKAQPARLSTDLTAPGMPRDCYVLTRQQFSRFGGFEDAAFHGVGAALQALRDQLMAVGSANDSRLDHEKRLALNWKRRDLLPAGRLVTIFTYGEVPAVQVGRVVQDGIQYKVVVFDNLKDTGIPGRSSDIDQIVRRLACRRACGFDHVMKDYCTELAETLHEICTCSDKPRAARLARRLEKRYSESINSKLGEIKRAKKDVRRAAEGRLRVRFSPAELDLVDSFRRDHADLVAVLESLGPFLAFVSAAIRERLLGFGSTRYPLAWYRKAAEGAMEPPPTEDSDLMALHEAMRSFLAFASPTRQATLGTWEHKLIRNLDFLSQALRDGRDFQALRVHVKCAHLPESTASILFRRTLQSYLQALPTVGGGPKVALLPARPDSKEDDRIDVWLCDGMLIHVPAHAWDQLHHRQLPFGPLVEAAVQAMRRDKPVFFVLEHAEQSKDLFRAAMDDALVNGRLNPDEATRLNWYLNSAHTKSVPSLDELDANSDANLLGILQQIAELYVKGRLQAVRLSFPRSQWRVVRAIGKAGPPKVGLADVRRALAEDPVFLEDGVHDDRGELDASSTLDRARTMLLGFRVLGRGGQVEDGLAILQEDLENGWLRHLLHEAGDQMADSTGFAMDLRDFVQKLVLEEDLDEPGNLANH